MTSVAVPVLTYHGYNVFGNDYSNNDHVALAEDLKWLTAHGWQIVSLHQAVLSLFDGVGRSLPERTVCITFDDGTDLDWMDVHFGSFGIQRGLHGILQDHCLAHAERLMVHATAFVIASPDTRASLAAGALRHGHGMADSWWREAESSRWMSIGNHSWDHRHPLVVSEQEGGGSFLSVSDERQASRQVVDSGRMIASVTGNWPVLFAYPWGHASDFLRFEFFPEYNAEHGCLAAFGTQSGPMHQGSDRWYIPRYVCGEHWQDPAELAYLLR